MKKTKTIAIFFLMLLVRIQEVSGQCPPNLIMNGNFDLLQTCASCCTTSPYPCYTATEIYQEINKAQNWTNGSAFVSTPGAPIVGTPDYYHINSPVFSMANAHIYGCSPVVCPTNPKNCYSHTAAYIRVQVGRRLGTSNYPRGESVIGQLNGPMQAGVTYKFSARVHHKTDGLNCKLTVRLKSTINTSLSVDAVLINVPNKPADACDWDLIQGTFILPSSLSSTDVANLNLVEIGGFYTNTDPYLLAKIYVDELSLQKKIMPLLDFAKYICEGQCVTINAGVPPSEAACVSVSWLPAGTPNVLSPSVCPTTTTTYTCTVTYGTQTFTTTTTVNVNPLPYVDVTPPLGSPFCSGETVTLNASTGGNPNVVWTAGSTVVGTGDPLVIIPSPGSTTYTATLTSTAGCVGSDSYTVHVIASPVVSTTLNYNAGCNCAPIQLGTLNTSTNNMTWTNGFSPIGVGGSFSPAPYIQQVTVSGITTYSFNPCAQAPGVYPIVYNYTDPVTSCTGQATGYITVGVVPAVSIDGNLTVCGASGTVLTANTGSALGSYTFLWSPGGQTTSSINVTTPGVYSVTVTNTANGCVSTETAEVILGGNWHQYTLNTTGHESANGVITDHAGNVYKVGTFRNTTTLFGGSNPNIQINSLMSPSEANAYVAKYDKCGNLIWVANTTNAVLCEGTSITMDEVNGMIYIGGNIRGNATFNSSQSFSSLCSSGFSESISTLNTQGYVAQYDATTGCLYFVEQVNVNTITNLNSLTINENNGELFVGGSFALTGASTDQYSYIRKYAPETNLGTGNSLLAIVWVLQDNLMVPFTYNVVRDLDYDEINNRIYCIGDFKKTCNLNNGVTTSTVNTISSISDAFFASYSNTATPIMQMHRAGGTSVSAWMTGEGVSVDAINGNPYFTGTYTGNIVDPFALGAATLAGVGPQKGYMIGMALAVTGTSWSRFSAPSNGTGSTFGRDVVAYNNRVYFLGEFSASNITAVGFGTWPYFGTFSSDRHVSLIAYTSTGAAIWMNVTQGGSATSMDNHLGNAIESDRNGNSYVVGQFGKQMDYWAGNPTSGMLNMTGGGSNAYIMRVDETNLDFRNSDPSLFPNQDEENNPTDFKINREDFNIASYPNPADESTIITLNNYDAAVAYRLMMQTVDGRTILEQEVIAGKAVINLSELNAGIYFVSVYGGKNKSIIKVIKINK